MVAGKIPPTRMQLSLMKQELKTAQHGHGLLKDKRDELVRRFMVLSGEARTLRTETERLIEKVAQESVLASAIFSQGEVEDCFSVKEDKWQVDITQQNFMGLSVPVMKFAGVDDDGTSIVAPSPEIYQIAEMTADLFPKLLELAQVEKTCTILAGEIEKVRRRVNALEYRTIPYLIKGIRYIRMKLDDKERENIIRMLKSKDYKQ